MYKRILMMVFTLILTMIIAVACSNSNNENDPANNEEDPAETEENNTNEEEDKSNQTDVNNEGNKENESDLNDGSNNEENNQDDNDSSNQDQSASDDPDLPEPIVIDEQIQHPNGVVFTLEEITFEEDHIAVDFNAQNGAGYEVYLASEGRAEGGDLGGITLEDDTGFDYRYVAESGPDHIILEEKEEVTGTASFMGRIEDDATTLTLIFNPNGSEDDPEEYDPKFSFENIEIER